ncbi:MAG TPA: serine/threonine-protein kinase [Candidatus Sulfotelmatobacter sp.]|nr:serine/threonine-protein kinase [Candidatus Sulfotelmatobacter sp.]
MSAVPKHWETVKVLFEQVLGMQPQDRARFLDTLPGDSVRDEVVRLLAEHSRASSFLSTPAAAGLQADRGSQPRLYPGYLLADRFKINRFIAAGGMGEVYEAEDLELGEKVALKTISSDLLAQPEAHSLFKREVHLARKVTHPNVCRVFDLFRHTPAQGEEIVFISMELLRGKTLSARLAEIGRFGINETLALVRQIAAGLSAAHGAGIIHRDLKPGNILLIPDNKSTNGLRVVVTDFGLAVRSIQVITSTDSTVTSIAGECGGTPAYMAPEQIRGCPATPASDVYSLGLVTYEMVTGERPFQAATPSAVILKRLSEPPIPPRHFVPELSSVWEKTILRCLETDPANRFQNVLDIPAELAQGIASLDLRSSQSTETQIRVLEAAAPKESRVGKSTEVLTIVRQLESLGLREYLKEEQEAVIGINPEDVRDQRFQLVFSLDSFGRAKAAEICLRLEAPDFEPRSQTKKLRVPPQGDSLPLTFLITPRIAGPLVVNLELLRDEEVVVSRPIRMRAVVEESTISEARSIVTVPLTIVVHTADASRSASVRFSQTESVRADKTTSSEPVRGDLVEIHRSGLIASRLRVGGAVALTLLLLLAGSLFMTHQSKTIDATKNFPKILPPPNLIAPQRQFAEKHEQRPFTGGNAIGEGSSINIFAPSTADSDRKAIQQTLARYQDAFARKNLREIEAVWPTIPRDERAKIETSFSRFDRIELNLSIEDDGIEAIGNVASVKCRRIARYFAQGSMQLQNNDNLKLQFQKRPAGNWIIQSITVE